jgi:hypothetical protein
MGQIPCYRKTKIISFNLTLTTTLGAKYYYYSDLTNEENGV